MRYPSKYAPKNYILLKILKRMQRFCLTFVYKYTLWCCCCCCLVSTFCLRQTSLFVHEKCCARKAGQNYICINALVHCGFGRAHTHTMRHMTCWRTQSERHSAYRNAIKYWPYIRTRRGGGWRCAREETVTRNGTHSVCLCVRGN